MPRIILSPAERYRLLLFSVLVFTGTFAFFRLSFLANQAWDVYQEPVLQLFGTHLHHWMLGLVLLPVSLLLLVAATRKDYKGLYMFSVLLLAFLSGMIADGLVLAIQQGVLA